MNQLFCGVLMVIGCLIPTIAGAQGYSPEEAAAKMTLADGFQADVFASEPLVRQPVSIDFDDRGRLWVLQYLQYPNPAGLKRVKVDRYSRTIYDRVPKPPPHGPRGADRLTILEDTDGDGVVDKSKDFVDGLNLSTGFACGYGGVFVLQVPYLLFYPDRDRDDVPDSDPQVLLKGFGMEDSSSLANSLIWGPDGWLYGTQGTNITANIRGIAFEQGVWRYHPISKKFELFSEGGGNSWGLDFDRKGNLLYATNYGGYLMHHGVQGSYHEKSFAKHGELHNPYAFGFFPHVPHDNFRGGHVTVGGFVYQGTSFPAEYRDKYIAADLLGHAVYWNTITPDGATFRTGFGGTLMEANDTWFAPSDAVMGPDGAVYIADWHDQRTAHPDPDAEWDRRNGRVIRISYSHAAPYQHTDLNTLSSAELVEQLRNPNNWYVRRARRILTERADKTISPQLQKLLDQREDDDLALEALWTIYDIGAFDESLAARLLTHQDAAPRDASLRAWTIRLLGDEPSISGQIAERLVAIAKADTSPHVLSQLACTAKRLTADKGIPIARALSARDEFADDPYIPLLVWWAVEQHAMTAVDQLLAAFVNKESWKQHICRNVILGRLMRRYAAAGSEVGFAACARLLDSAPNPREQRRLIADFDEGFQMIGYKRQDGLPMGTAFTDIATRQRNMNQRGKKLNIIPDQLIATLSSIWKDDTTDPLIVRVATRLGSQPAHDHALALVSNSNSDQQTRLAMLDILEELGGESCVAPCLQLLADDKNAQIKSAALRLLRRFSDKEITRRLIEIYPRLSKALKSEVRDVLLGRPESAFAYLQEIDRGALPAEDVSVEQLRWVALHKDEQVDELVRKHWGSIRSGTPEEKLAEIRRITNDLRAAKGNSAQGKALFTKHCGTCHQLFGEGKKIGPDLTTANRTDLTFLLTSLVDPGAQIRREFLSYVVVTTSGRLATGLLVEDTASHVTLLTAKDERITITRDDVDEMMPSTTSLMPENILKPLKPQELRDLFGYFQSKATQGHP